MTAALLVSPVFPPARGGIETMCREIVSRGALDWSVLTLDEPGELDGTLPPRVAVTRLPNVPRGGRRSIGRLTARAAVGAEAPRAEVVLSMHVRCVPAAALAHRRSRAPWFQYFHAKEVREYPRQARFALRHADGCLAVSGYTRDLLAELDAPGAARVAVVGPGVEAPLAARPRPAGPPTIVTVARLLHDYKGHDVLLDAVAELVGELPDLRWVVIGDGPRRGALEATARERGLAGHVAVLGAVDDAERTAWLRAAHVFALVSRTSPDGREGEGFGIVYREAGAHGVPSVGGTDGGVPDAVHDGVTGLLVPPRDAGAVAGALRRLLTDGDLAAELGANARTLARAASWESQVAAVERVLAGRHGGSAT